MGFKVWGLRFGDSKNGAHNDVVWGFKVCGLGLRAFKNETSQQSPRFPNVVVLIILGASCFGSFRGSGLLALGNITPKKGFGLRVWNMIPKDGLGFRA